MRDWHYRSLNGSSGINQVAAFQTDLSQETFCEIVPGEILYAGLHSGGSLVGAYDADRLIGVTFAIPGRRGKAWFLWSLLTAVLPEYRRQGVGLGLKQFQRSWALRQRYTSIGWGLDPLQAASADFSFHHLGAFADIYYENFSGEDGLGLPTDRLSVIWKLRDRRVRTLLQAEQHESLPRSPEADDVAFLLTQGSDCKPVVDLSTLGRLPFCGIEIPPPGLHIRQSDAGLALDWYRALREVFPAAVSRGFTVSDFVKSEDRCWYVLTASPPWFLYVLECADASLYTGITPDLERRVKFHNVGRGAAYTASRRPVKLLGAWRFRDRGLALSAESAFKKLSRPMKLRLLKEQSPYRGELFIALS